MLKAGERRNNAPTRNSRREADRPGNWMRATEPAWMDEDSAGRRAKAETPGRKTALKMGRHLRSWLTDGRDDCA